jgi:GrpB-like predicted nucleotidyltransferase (UPF0157 family)
MVKVIKQNYLDNKRIYDSIENKLRKNLIEEISIIHVGSTAIPNMYGKNIIDILIGAKDKEQFEMIVQVLIKNGFIPSKSSNDEIYQFFSSIESETVSGDIHIHLVISNTEIYNEFIILKDYLLNNEEEALEYSNFKKDIIKRGITQRREYKKIKSDYVVKLIQRAKKYYNEF